MRKVLIAMLSVLVTLMVALPALAEDSDKSLTYEFNDGRAKVVYLHDGHDNGVGTFDTNPFVGDIKRVDWLVIKPSENTQLMAGTGLTYLFEVTPQVTLAPIIGVGYDLTEDDNGGRDGHFVFGGSIELAW